MPFWLFPLNSCILLTKHHKLLLPDVPCSNARPHVQELMPKPLALPSLRWPLAALENHGRTVALHLHASFFLHRFVAGSAVHWWSVHLYLHLSGMCFFRPCIYFDSFQGNLEYSVFAYVFFWHHFREPKPTKRKKQSHSGLPNPKLISRSRECSISASCTAPVSFKNGVQTSLPWISCWPLLQAPHVVTKKTSLEQGPSTKWRTGNNKAKVLATKKSWT